MKIEVGMYAYFKNCRQYGIGKIVKTDDSNVMIKYKRHFHIDKVKNTIASFNSIDLIEVGDYVNGEKVILVQRYAKVNSKRGICLIQIDAYDINDNEQFLIKDIVTKEQFEKEKYVIGE